MTETTFLNRYDKHGQMICISYAAGYVMWRRKGVSMTSTMPLKKWLLQSVKPVEDVATPPAPQPETTEAAS